jgi:hypothetical protein
MPARVASHDNSGQRTASESVPLLLTATVLAQKLSSVDAEMDLGCLKLPQELLDSILDFLHDSPSDLKSCALTSRACVYRAQAHLFRHITLHARYTTEEQVWSSAQQTFHTSPHLVRHIRRLDLYPNGISADTFAAICILPFANLRDARIFIFGMSPQSALALRQLLSLPSLRDVAVQCSAEPATFLLIWDRCSSSIQHVDLACSPETSETFHSIPQRCSPAIQLESLRLRLSDGEGFRTWINSPMCPFDFSRLKALSIHGLTGVMSLKLCAHILQVLEIRARVRISNLSSRGGSSQVLIAQPTTGRPIVAHETLHPANSCLNGHLADYTGHSLNHCSLQPHPQDHFIRCPSRRHSL